MTCDGAPLTIERRYTPLVLQDLRIGDYDVVLRHPQLGEKTVRIAGATLKPDGTAVIWGRMDGPALQVTLP